MSYILPVLPYSYDALEPYIDAKTMEIHYTKHHQAYVDGLNNALKDYPELATKPIDVLLTSFDTLPDSLKTPVRNFGGGHANHSFFWESMKKNAGGQPTGPLAQAIKKQFGSFEEFQNVFNTNARAVFGSGWSWLAVAQDGNLEAFSMPNQDSPLLKKVVPILGLDVWEHAYYLKYQNRRPDYITAWWHVVDWDRAEDLYQKAVKQ